MKYKLKSLFLLFVVLSVILSLYSYETSTTVEIDRSYKIPVKLVPHPTIQADAFYSLVRTENLRDQLKKWQILDTCQDFTEDFPKPTNVRPMKLLTNVISVQRTELRSPLLNRKLGTTKPYDCIVIHTKHEYDCSYRTVGEGNWNDGQKIFIDLNTAIERAKNRNAPAEADTAR